MKRKLPFTPFNLSSGVSYSEKGKAHCYLDITGTLGFDIDLQEWKNSRDQVKGHLHDLNLHEPDHITLTITCAGGDAVSGFDLYDLLITNRIPVHTRLSGRNGMAALIALQAGRERSIAEGATGLICGDAIPVCDYINQNTVQQLREVLEQSNQAIIEFIPKHTNLKDYEVKRMMRVKFPKAQSRKQLMDMGFAGDNSAHQRQLELERIKNNRRL